MVIMKGFIFFCILIYASYCDIKSRKVPNYIHIMILIASFIGFEKSNINSMILGFILVPLPLLVSVVFKEDSIGGADIKLTAVCSFLLGFERGLIAVILGLALAILNTLALRKLMKKDIRESFPVVPYLAVGSLMAYLI